MSGQQIDKPTLVSLFQEVLGVADKSLSETLISKLVKRPILGEYFTNICTKELNAIHVDEKSGLVEFSSDVSQTNMLNRKPVGIGAFSTIYKSTKTSNVYKKIVLESQNEDELETMACEFFLEVMIQTLLSNDPVYGKNICKIVKVYRAEFSEPNVLELYIVMEYLTRTLSQAIVAEAQTRPSKTFPTTKVLPIINTINAVLGYFKKQYKFNHRDLHVGNIMFRNNEFVEPVLIDFGMSCLEFDGEMYSINRDNIFKRAVLPKPCESVDLLILLTSLIEYHENVLDEDAVKFIKDVSIAETGFNFINGILGKDADQMIEGYKSAYGELKARFHLTYPHLWISPGTIFHDAFRPVLPFKYLSNNDKVRQFICEYAADYTSKAAKKALIPTVINTAAQPGAAARGPVVVRRTPDGKGASEQEAERAAIAMRAREVLEATKAAALAGPASSLSPTAEENLSLGGGGRRKRKSRTGRKLRRGCRKTRRYR